MKKAFVIIKYLLVLLISFGLLYFAFKGVNIKSIIDNIYQAKISWLLVSIFIGLIALISRAYRWKLLIEPLGYSPTLKKTTYSLMIGYFANLAFPRLGEVSRCGALSKSEAIPFNKLLGTVIVERIIDVISLLICLLMAATFEYKRLGNFFTKNIFEPLVKKLEQIIHSPLSLTIIIICILALAIGAYFYIKRNKSKGSESKFSKLIKGLIEGLRSVVKLKRPWLFVLHSIFIWFLYYISVYTCFFALPSTAGLGLSAALFLLVAGGLGMSAPVQGGIGAYHLLVSQGLILYGLSQQDGLTFATLLHGLQVLMVVVCGVIALLLLVTVRKNK